MCNYDEIKDKIMDIEFKVTELRENFMQGLEVLDRLRNSLSKIKNQLEEIR